MSYGNVSIQRAELYRINDELLSKEVRSFLMQNFGCARKVYNLLVNDLYEKLDACGYISGPIPNEICFPEVSNFKKQKEYSYLKTADSLALANAKQHFQEAVKRFNSQKNQTAYTKRALRRDRSGTEKLSFRGLIGMPKFHSRKHGDSSYTTNCKYPKRGNPTIRVENHVLYVPKCKDGIPLIVHRKLPKTAVIKNVTISMKSDGSLYASVSYVMNTVMDFTLREAAVNNDTSILEDLRFLGLDYSQKNFYVDSNGKKANYPHFYRKSEEKLAKLRRQLSRMTPGSKNYNRKLLQIQKLERHIANQRKDFLHKLSTELVKQYDVIVVEDINLNVMGQCLSLGKNLHDNGFGMFRNMLTYKLDEKGSCLVKVPRFYASTKTCHDCGSVNPEVTLGVSEWICPVCGKHHDRDENAALNIRDKGKEVFLSYFSEQITKQEKAAQRLAKRKTARIQARHKKNNKKAA